MTLHEKIIKLYPELATFDFCKGSILLHDDGAGAYIAKWEHPTLPRPTDEELA